MFTPPASLYFNICEKISTFADRLLRGTLRAPQTMVLIVKRLAALTVSESTFEKMFFSRIFKKILKLNEHFKLQDSLSQ